MKTLTLAASPVPRTSEFVATIHSLKSTTVRPQVEGFIRRLLVKAGDRVTAGRVLAQIDPDRAQASVATTQTLRLQREADVAYARQQLARMQKLFEAGAVSKAELEQAETAEKTSAAQLSVVDAQIRESQVQLAYYQLTAPAAGIVGDIPIREGDRVTPSTDITTIDQADGLEAYVNVPLERAADLRLGLAVELLDDTGAVLASNPISFIAARADDATQSVLAKAALRTRPSGIRIEQYVRARVVWSTEPQLTVPVVAVNRISGQYFVYVAEASGAGAVARQKPVTVGDLTNGSYVVQSGLKAGDRVIVSNLQKIGDGAPVKPS